MYAKPNHKKPIVNIDEATFEELIQDLYSKLDDKDFDAGNTLSKLALYSKVPEDSSADVIQQLYQIIYECVPA